MELDEEDYVWEISFWLSMVMRGEAVDESNYLFIMLFSFGNSFHTSWGVFFSINSWFFFSDRTWNQLLYDFLYLYIFVLWIRVLVCFIFSSLVKCICGFVKVMTLWLFSWNGILIIHFAFTLCSLFCHASQIIAVFVSFIRCFLLEHKLNFYCYCLTDLSASC